MLREDRKSKPNGHFLDSNKPPKLKKNVINLKRLIKMRILKQYKIFPVKKSPEPDRFTE